MTESSPSSHGMSRKLPNAVPLDLYLTSSSDVVRKLACYVYEQYVQQRNCPRLEKLYPTFCVRIKQTHPGTSDSHGERKTTQKVDTTGPELATGQWIVS